MRKHGGELEQGWYRFTDQNIRDNVRHKAHCSSGAWRTPDAGGHARRYATYQVDVAQYRKTLDIQRI
ncbi:hypothetical protein [Marinobacterium sedimentorum]|uniref:hypothetical protein n=1 Tax=Marinobacterium sedimentorum TaxID=2927804 RepID=UPI0020C6D680|nr:hypothetical protein [Marinobacterium sedimentorum]MCP8689343.1 hypothetical protein [Marinobacterium sedimentorum]